MSLQLKPVDASRGPRWVADAFRLFARRPLAFTMLFVVFLAAALLVSLVPLLGALVQMMAVPMLSLGFMVAAQSALLDGAVTPRQFIEPLRGDLTRRRALLLLCIVYGLAALAILLLADALSGHAWARVQALIAKGEGAQGEIDAVLSEPGVGAAALLAIVLGSVLTVPFWHAPALVHWGGQSAGQALFSSTLAVWRGKAAFLTYMLTWLGVFVAFGVLAALVLGLVGAPQLAGVLGVPAGLVFTAVFYISVLFSFNDSFGGAAPAAPEPPAISPPA